MIDFDLIDFFVDFYKKMAVDTKLDQELNQMSLQQIVAQAQKLFEKRFGHTATVAAYSPGRVNLIGEHTDYNGGWVLPMVRKGVETFQRNRLTFLYNNS